MKVYSAILTLEANTGRRYQTNRQSSNSQKRAKQHRGPGLGSDLQAHRSNDDSSYSDFPPTSPLLYHPVPCRPTMPRLLRSQSSEPETTASNVAQVGMGKPETPSSDRHDNEAWRAFVAGPPRRLSSGNLPPQDGSLPEPLISPSISQYGRLGRAPSLEGRQSTSGYPSKVIPEDHSGVEESTVQALSRPPMEGTRRETGSLVSSCVDLQTSDQTPLDSYPDASLCHDIIPALKEHSPQTTNPNESFSDRSVTSAEDQNRGPIWRPAQQVDYPSIMAMPSSTDTSSEGLFKLFCNPSPVCRKQASTGSSTEESQPQEQGQDHQQGIAEVEKKTTIFLSCDEDNLWRKFVFGESSDGLEKALEDARKQTARSLCPSTTPISKGGGSVDIQESFSREGGSPGIDDSSALSGEEFNVEAKRTADSFDDSSTDITSAVSASHLATARNSSSDLLTEDIVQDSDTLAQTDRATRGSTSSTTPSKDVSVDVVDDFLNRSDVSSPAPRARGQTLSIAHAQLTEYGYRPESNFKFVPPKPFLGRKTSHIDEQRHISLSIPQVRGKNPTSRRQRRRKDGRTAIRTLPDFNDDPIEEFEEDLSSREMQQKSLFGSLEVDNDQ